MKYNLYTNNLRIAVFDIETMGLDPCRNIIISASFLDEDGNNLRQYFCEDPCCEHLILKDIFNEFSNLDAVITYNGKHFDMPFVFTRAKKYGMEDCMPKVWNIDIYRWLHKFWPAAKLMQRLNQASVEEALGIREQRIDEIDGAECINLYNSYLLTSSADAKDKILLHNADDVRQLCKIASRLSFLDFSEIIFKDGGLIKENSGSVYFEPVYENADLFTVNGSCNSRLCPISINEEYYSLDYDSYSGAVRLEIKPKSIEDYLYVDLTDLPVNKDDFINSPNYSNGYLIIKKKDIINYKEINFLIKSLLNMVVKDV